MMKRLLAILAVSGLVLVVPAVASASPGASHPGLTCSTTQAVPGSNFTCAVFGEDGDSAQLQATFTGEDVAVAGTWISVEKTVRGGEAVFTVPAPTGGGAIGIAGIVNEVAVANADVDVAGGLTATASSGVPFVAGASVLLVAGATLLFVGARRRSLALA